MTVQEIIDDIATIDRTTPQKERLRLFKKMVRHCTSYDFPVRDDYETAVQGLRLMVGKMVYRDTGENDNDYDRIFAQALAKKWIKKNMADAVQHARDHFRHLSATTKKLPASATATSVVLE